MIFPREFKVLGNGCIQLCSEAPKSRYRTLNYNGKRWGAHRLSYHLNNEDIPRNPSTPSTGLILHTCDNMHCINPDHLYIGTTEQNMIDVMERSVDWRAWVESLRGKPKSEETRKKLSEAKRRYHASKTPEERRAAMAGVQALANLFAQTPEAKRKRVESGRRTRAMRKEMSCGRSPN